MRTAYDKEGCERQTKPTGSTMKSQNVIINDQLDKYKAKLRVTPFISETMKFKVYSVDPMVGHDGTRWSFLHAGGTGHSSSSKPDWAI